jgi:hypothetical protein
MQRCNAGARHVLLGADLALVAAGHQILKAGLRDRDARLGDLQHVAATAVGLLADLDADAAGGDDMLKVLCHVLTPDLGGRLQPNADHEPNSDHSVVHPPVTLCLPRAIASSHQRVRRRYASTARLRYTARTSPRR